MARFIQVPSAITLVDPVTDAVLPAELQPVWTWDRSWRMAVTILASKGTLDALALIDLRRKGCGYTSGEWFELTEDEFRAIEPEFKRPDPRGFGTAWTFSAESHQRAVIDAPSKRPTVLVEPSAG